MSVKGINFKFGVRGDVKKNSSSEILKIGITIAKIEFGKLFNLFSEKGIKVKELIINPKKE